MNIPCCQSGNRATFPFLILFTIILAFLPEYATPFEKNAAVSGHFRFVVFGDSRGDKTFTDSNKLVNKDILSRVVHEVTKLDPKPRFVVFVGDAAIRGGVDEKGNDYYAQWKEIMNPLPAAGIPYGVAVGNHELYGQYEKGVRDNILPDIQKTYQNNFCNPAGSPVCFGTDPKLPGYTNMVSAFEYGDAFFIVTATYYLDGTRKYYESMSSDQLAWIREKSASTTKKFRFAFGHKPVFPSGTHYREVDESMLRFMDILNEYSFDIYFAGHEHYYVRWKMDDSIEPAWSNGVTHIVAGASGAPFGNPSPDGLNACAVNNHFVVIDVGSDRITGSVKGFCGPGSDLKVIDSFCLNGKGKSCPGWEKQERIVDSCIRCRE